LRIDRVVNNTDNSLTGIGQGGSNALIELRSGTKVCLVE
jgi:hypothetical protein